MKVSQRLYLYIAYSIHDNLYAIINNCRIYIDNIDKVYFIYLYNI